MITTAPGTALLLAAAPAGKGRLIDATRVLPTLAACPSASLTGTAAGTIVELADPVDQQTVLTRIRAAAAAPGPLTLILAGQLQLDSKQYGIHLALARATPPTLRYTGLPWSWLVSELKPRRAGSTTVLVDLVAAPDTWPSVRTGGLLLGHGISLYGRVAPSLPRHRVAAPAYLQAVAAVWRSGLTPPPAELHAHAAAQVGSEEALFLAMGSAEDAVSAPAASVAAEVGADPLPGILAAARAGQHERAAALAVEWEGRAARTYGPGSVQAIHWLEVRADLAHLAGDAARSCELWMAAGEARLTRHQPPDAPEVEAAVDRAHHQWQSVRAPERARALGPRLVSLRCRVPGQRPGATDAARRRLELLHTVSHVADGGGEVLPGLGGGAGVSR
ncbi:hypothetical protein [Streptomyces sp. NPDC001594]|uniref:hypothetical protein n=1 Tax=Streptomyces sp. NPDC001594 TaxID=3364590 RepID=UPI0036987765